MLLRLLEEDYPLDAVVFYDTGMEFESIYFNRNRIKKLLDDIGIPFIELKPEEPFLYSMLYKKIKYRNKDGYHYGYGWCGGVCRWHTSLKLRAINKFKQSLNDDVIDYVGIAADEPERFEKSKAEGKRLPLVEWGMTEADCLKYCYEKGFGWAEKSFCVTIELYDILDRVSCWCCRNKNLKELKNIYRYLPQYWNRLKELQEQIPEPFKGFYKGEPRGINELEERFKKEERNNK